MKLVKNFFGILSVIILAASCQAGSKKLQLIDKDGVIEIRNSFVKARFTVKDNTVTQEFFANRQGKWVLTAESFRPQVPLRSGATQLFNTSLDPEHRFLVSEAVNQVMIESQSENEIVVKLSGKAGDTPIQQLVKLGSDKDYFHFEVEAELSGTPAKLDYLLSTFAFNLIGVPGFVHTPGLKFDNDDSKQNRFKLLPAQDQIIGDRAFHAPAVILQDKNLFVALVPDLNDINKYAITSPDARRTIDIPRNIFSVPFEDDKYTMPTGLDLNVQSGLTEKSLLTYGLMDNIIAHHIRYQRVNDSTMVRTLDKNKVQYGFDLFVGADVAESAGFQRVSAHQWKMYGHPVFMNRPHLALPFEEYLRIVDSITFHPIRSKLSGEFNTSGRNTQIQDIDFPLKGFEDMGSWLQFEMNGLPVGGYRSAIPWWNDVIHNSTFWNNARDASGFYFWGQKLNKPELIDRAKRIINFCLSAPRNEQGLFATLYNANTKMWGLQFSDPPHSKNEFFLRASDSYEVPAMSKTAAHLLDYYFRCENDERIVQYFKTYADWLLTAIDERGAVPSYVTTKMEFSPILFHSAQPASSMWFLASYYNATKEDKYRNGAKRIAGFLEKDILPEAKWVDMEQYFSCGKKPLEFERDVWQHQVVRGNLANIWACEGFAALYQATGEEKYLKMGEQAIDYISFSQCVWEPHFIYTAFPFGGFAADNSDNAAMLDARQAEMVKPYIWYGKALARQDLLERGVAAAKSSVVLLNLPSHKENNIYRHTNIYPYGLGPENIDHEAHPQSAMRTHPSWGEGSGVFTGLAEAYRELNGGYIDFEKGILVGVNGIIIEEGQLNNNTIKISITNELATLKSPWETSYETALTITGIKSGNYTLWLNNKEMKSYTKEQLKNLKLKVNPNRTIEII
ncbi:MAG: hypothetical protein WC865_02895 [Bacteroidales bacterium]